MDNRGARGVRALGRPVDDECLDAPGGERRGESKAGGTRPYDENIGVVHVLLLLC